MKYPTESAELINLLEEDQVEWRACAKAQHDDRLPDAKLTQQKLDLRKRVTERGERALQILHAIDNKPSLGNIGPEAATALSVLAMHYSLDATKKVLSVFENCYKKLPKNTQISSIPAMADWIAVLERRPQKFGTIWLVDSTDHPFLPTIEDVENVNERRKAYGLEPLRWPKSLAVSEKDQSWLKRPISEAVIRTPTENELDILTEFYRGG